MQEMFIKLLQLINVAGKISGRKKLQKMIYILKHKGFEFDENYSYYYYGPYSSVLQMEIDELVRLDLLKEYYDDITYEYKVTKDADSYLKDNIFDDKQISTIKMLNREPGNILELVSVFFYLEDNGYTEKNAILKKTRILKPELVNHLDKAYELYSSIKGL